jgi:hypothetical protein
MGKEGSLFEEVTSGSEGGGQGLVRNLRRMVLSLQVCSGICFGALDGDVEMPVLGNKDRGILDDLKADWSCVLNAPLSLRLALAVEG